MNTSNAYRKAFTLATGIAVLTCFLQIGAHAAGVCTVDPDEMKHWYGNAGGPVGSEAITRTAKCGNAVRSNAPDRLANTYGRAGYPVGPDAIAATSQGGPSLRAGFESYPVVYGRAGYPVGSDAVAAFSGKQDRAPAVAQGTNSIVK